MGDEDPFVVRARELRAQAGALPVRAHFAEVAAAVKVGIATH